ncbi:MAG TPA: glutaredoxin family protein [Chloroflexota bacterium]|jgi:thiol-disulfide isomerase/thioredoxin
MREVRLFGKPGCHLCELAEDLLEDLREEYGISVLKIDITSDHTLFDRYRYEIPVVALPNGASIGGRITIDQIRSLLVS